MRKFITTASSLTLAFCFVSHTAYGMEEKKQIIRAANLRLQDNVEEPPTSDQGSSIYLTENSLHLLTEEKASELKNLYCLDDVVLDLNVLSHCTQLEMLALQQHTPCEILGSLTTLTELHITGDWDFDHNLPKTLTNLTRLGVTHHPKMEGLPSCFTNLTSLRVEKSTLSPEGMWSALKDLTIFRCTSTAPLSCPKLETLALEADSGESLSVLNIEALTGLKTLALPAVSFGSFPCLTTLTHLTVVGHEELLPQKISHTFPNLVHLELHERYDFTKGIDVEDLSNLWCLQKFSIDKWKDLQKEERSIVEDALGETVYRNWQFESMKPLLWNKVSLLWPFFSQSFTSEEGTL
jgi:hypothetical protein